MTVAVVTGASRGLGRLIALELAKTGTNLLLVGRDKEQLLATAKTLKGVRVALVEADLADSWAVDQIARVAHDFGGADILINNAAMQRPIGNSWDVSASAFNETFHLNFSVPAALCRALIPGMIAKGEGWIVNLSGGGATSPRPMFSAYGAAKTALVRFGETLASECAENGVRVNSVAPGAFKSGMTEAVLQAGSIAGQNEALLANRLMLEDSGAAEKAAALIAYLVAGEGRDVTGKLISAVWDDWQHLHENNNPPGDFYTLRRTVPPERVVA
jgi:NAD(P)-dependent dehydrogenase (short-subunit alcohol dehydrogenase family)